MKFYRVIKLREAGTSAGYEYYTDKYKADQALKAWAGKNEDRDGSKVETIEVGAGKMGILRALQVYGAHPDNG